MFRITFHCDLTLLILFQIPIRSGLVLVQVFESNVSRSVGRQACFARSAEDLRFWHLCLLTYSKSDWKMGYCITKCDDVWCFDICTRYVCFRFWMYVTRYPIRNRIGEHADLASDQKIRSSADLQNWQLNWRCFIVINIVLNLYDINKWNYEYLLNAPIAICIFG